ncbi:MAG: hypothetical protein V3W44_02295 [Dehalococcoidales bacterium]
MYTGTMALQRCSYCPALRGPGQLKPYDARIMDGDEVVKEGRYLACDECAEKIGVLREGVTKKARGTRQRHGYERVKCQECDQLVAENWLVRHMKADCKVGVG